jgi:hypothetical protein
MYKGKEIFQGYRNTVLQDKIDVTSFWAWLIENYSQSAQIMKENPNYQYRFK